MRISNKQNGFGVVEIFLVLAIIGLIGTIGFLTWRNMSSNNPTTKDGQQSITKKVPILQPSEVVDRIKSDLAAKYTLLDLDKNNQPRENEMSIRESRRSPIWKAEGYDFYVSYDSGAALDIHPNNPTPSSYELPTEESKSVRRDITRTYEAFDLKKTDSRAIVGGYEATDIYTGKGLVCTVESIESQTSANTAACGLLSEYKDAAVKAKPLVDTLPRKTDQTAVGSLKITDSQTQGYQKATLLIGEAYSGGGAAALFYKKGSGQWAFFASTQEIIECSRYNSADLKNAFKGDACYDTAALGETTVQ